MEIDHKSIPCPYCNGKAYLQDNAVLYHGKSYGLSYICENYPECDSYVGVHRGTDTPLGTVANGYLRSLRMRCHNLFDDLWIQSEIKRSNAYSWLSKKMNIPKSKCHFGMFDIETCQSFKTMWDHGGSVELGKFSVPKPKRR